MKQKEKEKLTYEEKLKLHKQWVKFYREHKWVKQENGRWKFVEFNLTKVYNELCHQLFVHVTIAVCFCYESTSNVSSPT